MPAEIKPITTNKPPPLLRSRTLPSIVVPGLSILQAQIDAKYKAGKHFVISSSSIASLQTGKL
ncbi:UNVERIFIED_CONTAM: hypothetical protein PYX00_000201 [Menopon gallinae]|uniref:Uncharacterized protein n=1 Tax=Menopon gallinae TaxID=328185 RepID=A0AAW2I835_9NEOP